MVANLPPDLYSNDSPKSVLRSNRIAPSLGGLEVQDARKGAR